MILLGKYQENELIKKIRKGFGSTVAYFGYVRDISDGRNVRYMVCGETQNSQSILKRIEEEIREKYPVKDVLLYHSIGKVDAGDLLAAVLVSTIHREEGFKACRYGIDRIKELEPVERDEFS